MFAAVTQETVDVAVLGDTASQEALLSPDRGEKGKR